MLTWRQSGLIGQMLLSVVPQANRHLATWKSAALRQLQHPLCTQALNSLSHKRFHAQGAASYALLAPTHRRELVALTVALQTISDYLDNLCDRLGVIDEMAFRCVHQALLFWECTDDADYYRGLTPAADRGYLAALSRECHRASQQLPSWPLVQPLVAELLGLYIDLQVYKHLQTGERTKRLLQWHRHYAHLYPHLHWNEFAAACGSTLGVFALLAAASAPDLELSTAKSLHNAYFPTICSLHILLDYLIDEREDRQNGDLNFISYYPSREYAVERLLYLLDGALASADDLPNSTFHRTLVGGLLAVYLSDPKANTDLTGISGQLLRASGTDARALHRLARGLRQLNILQKH